MRRWRWWRKALIEQLFESLEISRDHAEALALYDRESERFGLRVPSHPFPEVLRNDRHAESLLDFRRVAGYFASEDNGRLARQYVQAIV